MNTFKISPYSISENRFQKYIQKVHNQRLKEIKKKDSKLFFTRGPCKIKKKPFLSGKTQIEKELQCENIRIVNKLIKIAKKKENFSIRSFTPVPKTLNSIIRKKETCRIDEENQRIVNRILSKSPVLSTKSLQKEYNFYNQCKNRISKFPLSKPKRAFSTKELKLSKF